MEISFALMSTSNKKLGRQRRVHDWGVRMVSWSHKLPVAEDGQGRLVALESWYQDGQDGKSEFLYWQGIELR